MHPLRRLFRALPAHVLNGIGVALGIGLAQALGDGLGGTAAALGAAAGAVYASLPDLPGPPRRWRQVLAAAVLGGAVSLLVGLLRPHPVALGAAVALIGFGSSMTLAWGARAGPISFVGILAFVFSMALPAASDSAGLLRHLGWTAFGGGVYLAWSVGLSRLLQRRWRALALDAALAATAALMRSRAQLLAEAAGPARAASLQWWMACESRLDERLQAARDLLFAAPGDDPLARRQTAVLLRAIDLRETLLLGGLDLGLLGADAPAAALRGALAAALREAADAVEAVGRAWRDGRPLPGRDGTAAASRALEGGDDFPALDARAGLARAERERARHLLEDLRRMEALMRVPGVPPASLGRGELQLFVTNEAWPAAALARHATLRSPVLRHALRTGLALAFAYHLALALPWASHPYWLVLSVAVVLRGTLEQTLARRNARVAGTVAGCLIVLVVVSTGAAGLASVLFLVAAGVAHAFVAARYGVTAAAATVMALLQVQMAQGLDARTLVERLADTLLGALLAWAFSYVLPSWERHQAGALAARVRDALAALASAALRASGDERATVGLRLARREAYEALGSLAAAAQRGRVEPRRVRLAPQAYADLHAHGHALLAHLAAVRVLLARRGAELDPAGRERLLQAALPRLLKALRSEAAVDEQLQEREPEATGPAVPQQLPAQALLPWLERRLRLAVASAGHVGRAAAVLQRAAVKD